MKKTFCRCSFCEKHAVLALILNSTFAIIHLLLPLSRDEAKMTFEFIFSGFGFTRPFKNVIGIYL